MKPLLLLSTNYNTNEKYNSFGLFHTDETMDYMSVRFQSPAVFAAQWDF